MKIETLNNLIQYKELFNVYPVFKEAYNSLKKENQFPFLELIQRVNEGNYVYIPSSPANILTLNSNNVEFFGDNFFYPGDEDRSYTFFIGSINKFDKLWYVYFDVTNNIILYVLSKINKFFFKKKMIQTNSSIFENETIMNLLKSKKYINEYLVMNKHSLKKFRTKLVLKDFLKISKTV